MFSFVYWKCILRLGNIYVNSMILIIYCTCILGGFLADVADGFDNIYFKESIHPITQAFLCYQGSLSPNTWKYREESSHVP